MGSEDDQDRKNMNDQDATYKEEDEEEGQGDNEQNASKRKRKRKRKKKTAEETEDDAVEDQHEHDPSKDMVHHTVYVEGIPFDATPDEVKDFFVQGDVHDVVELRLPTWQDSGRLRGYGHVLFESKQSFEKALELSGRHLGKRYLTIQAANTPRNGGSTSSSIPESKDPPPADCRTLYVSNLPYNASENEISGVFESLGVTIPDDGVRIARNSVNRQSKGFCYIDFETPEDARKVMESSRRLTVNGRLLRLDWDTGRMKGSYRSDSGRLWTKEIKEKNKRARVGR